MIHDVRNIHRHNTLRQTLPARHQRNLPLHNVTDFVSVTGKGVTGRVGERQVAIGNSKLLDQSRTSMGALEQRADEVKRALDTES